MRKLASSDVRYGGVLEGFRDVLAADATVIRLHRLLARRFPGTRTNSAPAAAKLHLVMSVRGTGAHKVKVTGERAKDHRTLQMGPWVEGRLLLFDLGYFRYQLFDCIDRNGGYFITRLAANANPRIVAIHRQWRGRAIDLEGKRLKEVASRLQRDVLDVEVEVAFQRRVYAGTRRSVRRRVRLVAVRLPESTEYRFYLTNIDPDSLDAQCVAQTYAARWQIELIFKELKSHYRLDELPTSKAHIVETLLLGAVCQGRRETRPKGGAKHCHRGRRGEMVRGGRDEAGGGVSRKRREGVARAQFPAGGDAQIRSSSPCFARGCG